MAGDELTPYERTAIQMAAVVPLVRDLQAILGEEVVLGALKTRVDRAIARSRAKAAPKADLAHTAAAFNKFARGDALDYEVLASDAGTLHVDVTRCRYADLMERLEAADLGPWLICQHDYAMSLDNGVELTRTQTRMEGASHCDFRFTRRGR